MASVRVLLPLVLLGAAAASAGDCEGSHCRALALDGDSGGSVSLLQHRGRGAAAPSEEPVLAPMDPESQQQRLDEALPFAWVHIPKCGSSLVNFLVHLPGVCPQVPEDAVVSEEAYGGHQLKKFKKEYRVLEKDGACNGNIGHWGDHNGVAFNNWDDVYKGRAFIMLRQPEQRVMSGYSCNQHSWPAHKKAANPLEYAEGIQGCVVRMLTRGGKDAHHTCGGKDGPPINNEEVELAVHRIRNGFAFVGLTDQWALSMCLGRRKFGGKCLQSDFVDGRVTTQSETGEKLKPTTQVCPKARMYDTSELHGFTDPYDGAVYAAGVEVFNDECRRYNVSIESCQSCFEEAGVEVEQ